MALFGATVYLSMLGGVVRCLPQLPPRLRMPLFITSNFQKDFPPARKIAPAPCQRKNGAGSANTPPYLRRHGANSVFGACGNNKVRIKAEIRRTTATIPITRTCRAKTTESAISINSTALHICTIACFSDAAGYWPLYIRVNPAVNKR